MRIWNGDGYKKGNHTRKGSGERRARPFNQHINQLTTQCSRPKQTQITQIAAGSSPPPSTLSIGTLSRLQERTDSSQSVTAYGLYAVTSSRQRSRAPTRQCRRKKQLAEGLDRVLSDFCPAARKQGPWINVKTLNPSLRKVLGQRRRGVRTLQ